MSKFQLSFLGLLCGFYCSTLQAESSPSSDKSALRFSGKVMLDWHYLDGLHNENQQLDEFYVRRADLKGKYSWSKSSQFRAQLAYDKNNDEIELKDWRVKFNVSKHAFWTLGRFKEPIGMEKLLGSSKAATVESSLATNALLPGRNLGLMFTSGGAKHYFQFGLFDNDSNFEFTAITGRIAFAVDSFELPLLAGTQFHFGASTSIREHDVRKELRINESIESYLGNTIVESRKMNAETEFITGLEFAAVSGNLLLESELLWRNIDGYRKGREFSQSYNGSYVQLSYVNNASAIKYDDGQFQVAHNTAPTRFYIRLSQLDVREDEFGSIADNVSIGSNYYFSPEFKTTLEVTQAKLSGKNAVFADKGKTATFRFMYRF